MTHRIEIPYLTQRIGLLYMTQRNEPFFFDITQRIEPLKKTKFWFKELNFFLFDFQNWIFFSATHRIKPFDQRIGLFSWLFLWNVWRANWSLFTESSTICSHKCMKDLLALSTEETVFPFEIGLCRICSDFRTVLFSWEDKNKCPTWEGKVHCRLCTFCLWSESPFLVKKPSRET